MVTAGSGNPIFNTCVSLFTNKHAKDMHDRQIHTLARICQTYEGGFFVADLPILREIIEHVAARVEDGLENFVDPLCMLLGACSVPFVKETASEEYRSFEALCAIVRTLGLQLLSRDRRVQLAAGSMLVQYAAASEGQPATISYHHQVIEHSAMANHLSQALKAAEDIELFDQLLQLVLELSRTRELASQLVANECLPTVIGAFRVGFKTESVSLAVESVWNIIELVEESSREISTLETVETFKHLFDEMVEHGHRQQDKELRNQLLVLFSYLVQHDACHAYFAQTGLLEAMMNVAFALESDHALSTQVKHFVLTNAHEDFEMKRTLMHLVCQMCQDPACTELVASHPSFVPGMVLYIDERISEHPARRKFTKQQERLLQVQCLACLFTLVPHCHELFREVDGNQIVLEFMTEQSEETLRSGCLKLLLNTASLPGFQEDLGGRCVAMMLSLIREKGLHPLHIRQDAICVLARLCRGSPENQDVVGQLQGVGVLTSNLDPEGEDVTVQSKAEPMVLSAVDGLWAAVAGNRANELALDEAGGLGMLLSLLETSDKSMHHMVVSCLCELLENEDLREGVSRWRSESTRRGAVPLALKMWEDEAQRKEEEARLRVEMHVQAQGGRTSEALVEELTGHSMHTKLFALLGKLEFATEEKLTAAEQKRLLEIERYLALEDAALWKTFSNELLEDGIRPVTPDHRRMHDRFARDEGIERELSELVLGVEEREKEEEEADMRKFFERVHLEQAAKNSTARRIQGGAPTSTRTKIIVDSHKSQIFPALINPQAAAAAPPPPRRGGGEHRLRLGRCSSCGR